MSYVAPGTPDNVALAQHVNGRLRAETRIVAARAFLFRAAGLGLFAALAGIGIGSAAYGWSYVQDYRSGAERIAQALQAALSDVTLKTVGEVSLKDGVVRLDPEARVKVAGEAPAAPGPTASQLKADAAPASKATVSTSFTIFKQVPYLDGQIVTGWNYKPNEDAPFQQYCYFTRVDSGPKGEVKVQIDLAIDGKTLPQPPASEYKLAVLATNCVWHAKG
jgi:hypothetical protein